ncbi:endonuclease NucS [Natronolimnohabitans sp. A-GB9]|uniref:endonuclease NucS n=1 Tax=Natronolimnohabitans sp. A-GB9 TaxID=3069757 RepID=UPI0027B3AAE8|nr:endonuclease NucS [Natronolimnohabitans sp. A-GB9]MDQ2049621.1 endonuclease NucS [Natronolimnohabitans sp. A-GB9]
MTSGTSPSQSSQVVSLEQPTLSAACEAIADGIEREALVTVFGRCTVDYEGRASSTLEAGDRHVMLKPDGAALVHTDEGQQPVNWQPPGCEHDVFCEGPEATDDDDGTTDVDALVLESARSTPDERLRVRFQRVLQVSAFSGTDENDLSLSGTEEDLRRRILEEPSLLEPGFTPLATERDTPAGAVDIYGEDTAGRTVVVELKRRRVGPDAVGQLRRYVDALERDLHAGADVRGILVAPSVTDRADRLLVEHGLEFVSLEPTA